MAICTKCSHKIETPGVEGICYGCHLDAQITDLPAYQEAEQYRDAVDDDGMTWPKHARDSFGIMWKGHINATCRPLTDLPLLDEQMGPKLSEALKACKSRPRF